MAGLSACSKSENTTTTTDSSASATSSTSSASSSAADSGNAPVRGTLASITDNEIVISSRNGNVSLAVASPLTIYTRVPAKLSDVKSNSFVGVTSVTQADGSQHATEIHIFPEQLRGMGEGSRPMGGPNGGGQRDGGGASGGGNNTMTNGTVSGSQMTNGTASTMTNGTASTMTNGSISSQKGGTLTVQYAGGTKTITVPPNVTVTAITPTTTKPAPGANVVVVTAKQPDGSVKATAVMIAGGTGRGR
jgi:hypothetical protein